MRNVDEMDALRWGRERTFGQLFAAGFGMANAHRRWLVPLVVTCTVPHLALMIAGQNYALRDPERLARMIRNSSWESMERMISAMVTFGIIWLTVVIISSLFMQSSLFGTLVAAGRGEPLSLGLAFREGLRNFGKYLATALWVGFKLFLWLLPSVLSIIGCVVAVEEDVPALLLLLIPLAIAGFVFFIIKQYAYMFAVPLRMAGDADNAFDAVRLSVEATRGRKGYLFGYCFVMGLLIGGISMMLNLITQEIGRA